MRIHPALPCLILIAASSLAPALDSYVMDVRLDPAARLVTGTSIITWTNPGTAPASELRLHLYPNAFESPKTTLWRESPFLKSKENSEEAFSRLTLNEARLDGADRPLELRFEQPDDGNADDHTVGVLPLPAPVAPGASIVLRLTWETRLHTYFFRSGTSKDSAFLMQWYPKLAVFSGGAWICHQAHSFTEFFSDFADYTVTLHLPAGWTAAATGRVTEGKASDGGVAVEMQAENVHDMAIAASRSMKKIERDLHPRQGDPVHVTLFIPEEYAYKQHRIFSTLDKAFAFLADWTGPFLWDQFTAVFPTWRTAGGHGGMEYPQLVVCGLRHGDPSGSRDLEYVLSHEFIHQYFYGMIATDEVENPWMDEGFTAYLAGRFMQEHFPDTCPTVSAMGVPLALTGQPLSPVTQINLNYYKDTRMEEMGKPGYAYADYLTYRINAYNKPALALATMENYVGRDPMKAFLRDYFSKYAFAHPGPKEVLDLIGQHFGSHWSTLFSLLLKKPSTVDYRVLDAQPHACTVGYQGDLALPVEVRVTFSDGSVQTFTHDPRDRVRRYEFPDKTITAVAVDPERRLLLDADPRNNTRMITPPRLPSFGYLWSRLTHLLEQFGCWF